MLKVCVKCKKSRKLTSFGVSKREKDGLQYYCKDCTKRAGQDWYKKNKVKVKDKSLQWNYGITLAQYDEMFAKQNSCCAICKRHQKDLTTRLAVDHNHHTGEVRGLLCTSCNRMIGFAHDSLEVLESAKSYLISTTSLRIVS